VKAARTAAETTDVKSKRERWLVMDN